VNTRDRIFYTALELFASHGINKASMHDIAVEVGISKAGIYHHFPSKEVLIEAVVELAYFQFLERLISILEDDDAGPVSRLGEVFEFSANEVKAWIDELPGGEIEPLAFDLIVMEAIVQYPRLGERYYDYQQQYLAAATTTLEEGKRRGEIRADLDCAEGAQALVAMLDGTYYLFSSNKNLDITKTYKNMSKMYMMIIKP
jgi:AcrR family transcriptional regulator